jgi:hypothetical protein
MRGAFRQDRVAAALRKAWSLRTSGTWTAANPARGQCNVTALLVEELFDGEILKTPLPEGDHFYNRIDGRRIDLTASQFEAPIAYADLPSSREEALAGTTAAKCEALKAAFSEAYGGGGAQQGAIVDERACAGPTSPHRHLS